MRKFLTFIIMAIVPLFFAACDDDHDYYYGTPGWQQGGGGSSALNQYEKGLVGSYISDDDPDQPFYLVLRNDRTGYFKSVSGGQTTGDEFTWSATSTKLAVIYKSDGSRAVMDYYYSNNHLYVDGIPLVANNTDVPGTTQSPLVGQWEGKINGFYSALYAVSDDSCATVCEFASNGDGTQLDYNIYKPKTDFAYTPFTWSVADGVIVLTYVENALPKAIISDYALSATRFSGTVAYDRQWFGFAYTATEGFDWTPYANGGTRAAAGSRMSMSRHLGGQPVRLGSFAR